jgi:hypothetical protein
MKCKQQMDLLLNNNSFDTAQETWVEFMDRAKRNGLSPTMQEQIDRGEKNKKDALDWHGCDSVCRPQGGEKY